MARPRSIGGLLLRLAVLHARRRPGWFMALACAAVALVAWPRGHSDRTASGLQVGVLRDGFVLTHLHDGARRVIELDVRGQQRRTMTLPHDDDRRVVGTTVGTAVGWLDAQKIHFARVEDGEDLGSWGKAARKLCDGVASNRARFGVGWLESDETVWFVHGPVADKQANDAPLLDHTGEHVAAPGEPLRVSSGQLAGTDWCGVASAEDNIALLWRTTDRLHFTMCSKRRCSTLSATFTFDRKLPILGFGCLRNACLVASRDAAGNARVSFLTQTSRSKWARPLATAASTVSIVGVGDRAFAVGYDTDDGAQVVRIDREGTISAPLWRSSSASAPTLAWSSGQLLIAHQHGDAIIHHVIPLER